MAFPDGFDKKRGDPNGTPPAARTVGHDGSGGDTKAAERPSVPAPATDHGNTPVPGLKNSKSRKNPTYGKR